MGEGRGRQRGEIFRIWNMEKQNQFWSFCLNLLKMKKKAKKKERIPIIIKGEINEILRYFYLLLFLLFVIKDKLTLPLPKPFQKTLTTLLIVKQ